MRTLFWILMLTGAAFAQEQKARAVEPVRVTVVASGAENAELRKEVIKELQRLRVAVVSKGADFGLQLAGAKLEGDCDGVVVAVLTSTPAGHDLQVLAGANWQEVAKYLVERIKEDFKGEK